MKLPRLYITTPIFYVNAAPHLGHFYSMLLCDVKNRWFKLATSGSSYFTTGTDEHGLKVQTAALMAKKDTKLFCDDLSASFKKLAQTGNIDYNRFIRTTDPDHISTVKAFWKLVHDQNLIYKGEHSGWYSISDETFYPLNRIEKRGDKMYSVETGSEVSYQVEENYFFRLSQFREPLIKYLKQHPSFIFPKKHYDDILRELEREPLPDLSVSRPSSRLKWGVSVPGDDTQKVYVWFDALVNYLSSIGGVPVSPEWWPGVHLIGKDIIRFHCIYWPAFLMAAKIDLPKQVIVHGHWLMDGSKMSKSKGNVVDPFLVCNYYGMDSLRLFLLGNSQLNQDNDFTEHKLNTWRNIFIDKYCNLLLRCISKKFSISRALTKSGSFQQPPFENEGFVEKCNAQMAELDSLFRLMNSEMDTLTTHKALNYVWELMFRANEIMTEGEPWNLKKDLDKQDYIIFLCLETVRISSILMQPFIPEYSTKLLGMLNVASARRSASFAKVGADLTYGVDVKFSKGSQVPLQKVSLREGAYA